VTKEKEEHHSNDDFGGISRGEAAFVLIAATLFHPWQALKELLTVLRRGAARRSGSP
jgi:hypothetical protein